MLIRDHSRSWRIYAWRVWVDMHGCCSQHAWLCVCRMHNMSDWVCWLRASVTHMVVCDCHCQLQQHLKVCVVFMFEHKLHELMCDSMCQHHVLWLVHDGMSSQLRQWMHEWVTCHSLTNDDTYVYEWSNGHWLAWWCNTWAPIHANHDVCMSAWQRETWLVSWWKMWQRMNGCAHALTMSNMNGGVMLWRQHDHNMYVNSVQRHSVLLRASYIPHVMLHS